MYHFSMLSAVVAGIAALSTWDCQPHHVEHHEDPTYLVTSPLEQDTELQKDYVAQIRAIQHIELRALERGYLQGIFVDEGQQTRANQKMFQIMPLIYQAEVNKAKAEADVAKIEYTNTETLADRDIVSKSELALSRAKFSKAKAQLSLAETHQRMTEVRAPFDGIMGRFYVRKGSLVDEGELLTTLSDNSTVWVYFNVTESEYLEYKENEDAYKKLPIKLMMANGKYFDQAGNIETIEADFDNETGTIAFRAAFPNPEGVLRHGETGKIVVSEEIPKALLIPQKATFEILDRHYVYVVDENGTVSSRPVTIRAELPHLYIVESGITASEKILIEGLRKVHDGEKIHFQYENPGDIVAQLELPAQ